MNNDNNKENKKYIFILLFIFLIFLGYLSISLSDPLTDSKRNITIESTIIDKMYREEILSDGMTLRYMYPVQIGFPDQNEINIYHSFNDVIKLYRDNLTGKLILNITNYYTKKDISMSSIINIYIIDNKNRKFNLKDISTYYKGVKTEFILIEHIGSYQFYPKIKDIPVISLGDNINQPLVYIGYEIENSNININVKNYSLLFQDVLYFNAFDLYRNGYNLTLDNKGIKIYIKDKVDKHGSISIDPVISLGIITQGYVQNSSGGFIKFSLESEPKWKVGTILEATPTPPPPP